MVITDWSLASGANVGMFIDPWQCYGSRRGTLG